MSAEASWEEAVRSGLRATASENRVAALENVAKLPSEPDVTACTACPLTEWSFGVKNALHFFPVRPGREPRESVDVTLHAQ